jgi:hypothetical protein
MKTKTTGEKHERRRTKRCAYQGPAEVYRATDGEQTIDEYYTAEYEHYYEEEPEYDEEQCAY